MRQVNELIRTAVAKILVEDLELPLDVFVTVTSVDTSRDLQNAIVYLTVIPDGKRVSTIKKIEQLQGRVQKMLGQRISLKYTPKLQFRFDEGAIKAQNVYAALNEDDNE